MTAAVIDTTVLPNSNEDQLRHEIAAQERELDLVQATISQTRQLLV